jgi:hypothetical protein
MGVGVASMSLDSLGALRMEEVRGAVPGWEGRCGLPGSITQIDKYLGMCTLDTARENRQEC